MLTSAQGQKIGSKLAKLSRGHQGLLKARQLISIGQ